MTSANSLTNFGRPYWRFSTLFFFFVEKMETLLNFFEVWLQKSMTQLFSLNVWGCLGSMKHSWNYHFSCMPLSNGVCVCSLCTVRAIQNINEQLICMHGHGRKIKLQLGEKKHENMTESISISNAKQNIWFVFVCTVTVCCTERQNENTK